MEDLGFDLTLATPTGRNVIVEIKRTHSMRDVRNALLSLVTALAQRPDADALCLVYESRLSSQRLEEELSTFRELLRPDLAERVYLAMAVDQDFQGTLPRGTEGLLDDLRAAIQRDGGEAAAPRVSRQHVMATLVQRWLDGFQGSSITQTQRLTGASRPTVAAAHADLRAANVVRVQSLMVTVIDDISGPILQKLAQEYAKTRKLAWYTDVSGMNRSPAEMASRLLKLQASGRIGLDVQIGGVIGAKEHYSDLDLTAAPRLDLCVYGSADGIARHLDAGLQPIKPFAHGHPFLQPSLVLHEQRPLADTTGASGNAAPSLDCLADLMEMGLEAQAQQMASFLVDRARGMHR
ncbi:hypothetical protein ACG02S_17045 [Roseateles sp. DC23W]|uniref:PD-(D/E)XK nuclease family protein n=1 Tax=Pelomonas dachongensis TaxID=3299029 RepID=A0ABW7EQ45_9BURK